MSAVPAGTQYLRAIGVGDIDRLMAIESAAYAFPWSRGNFVDSIAAGYWLQALCTPAGEWLGYLVAMAAVDELHLLNLTVAPAHQGHGHGRFLLDAVCSHARATATPLLWLEVRQSNARAIALYLRYGFRRVGMRRGYYPATGGRREDATVMSLDLGRPERGSDALD